MPNTRFPTKAFTTQPNRKVILRSLITDVKLSEAFDPQKAPKKPKIHETNAIWDTGATNSVITKSAADSLGLKPTGKTKVAGIGGVHTKNVYLVNIYLPNEVVIPGIPVTEGELESVEVLIGMDIITLGDFAISNVDNKTVFSFRIPSQKVFDFVKEANESKKIGRNDPCPCGSGKKYKQCHGKP